jgi:AraC-like DNA-binding protein
MQSHLDRVTDWISLATKAQYRANELARLTRVSQRHLERYFGDCFGKAPQDWLNELRLVKAALLLSNGVHIKEVADQLGFRDVPHFSHRFKRYHGCSPSQFVRIYDRRMTTRRKQFETWFPGEEVPSEWLVDPCLIRPWEVLLLQPRRRTIDA